MTETSQIRVFPDTVSVCDQGFGLTVPALLSVDFNTRAVRAGARIVKGVSWIIDTSGLTPDGVLAKLPVMAQVELVVAGHNNFLGGTSVFYSQQLLSGQTAWVNLGFSMGDLSVAVAAPTAVDALAAIEQVRECFPSWTPPVIETKPTALVKFWWMSTGPTSVTRNLDVVNWAEIGVNYPGETRVKLEQLMATFQPRRSGQLLLFHGPPGTGKTYAIRALAWQWRKWCSLHYIMDVPTFLGAGPDYLNRLLFGEQGSDVAEALPILFAPQAAELGANDSSVTELSSHGQNGHWRLVVMEDSGELLAQDARERTGAALARLLNAADGLLGQGSRVMFLITTNEPLDALHPAVTRPGRCAANLGFDRFSRAEAAAWLTAHGAPADLNPPKEGGTVAELYELLENHQQIIAAKATRSAPGFVKAA